jgi:hypothetical protein
MPVMTINILLKSVGYSSCKHAQTFKLLRLLELPLEVDAAVPQPPCVQ